MRTRTSGIAALQVAFMKFMRPMFGAATTSMGPMRLSDEVAAIPRSSLGRPQTVEDIQRQKAAAQARRERRNLKRLNDANLGGYRYFMAWEYAHGRALNPA